MASSTDPDHADVYSYLRRRNVQAELIEKMKEDKVDVEAIKCMSDIQLTTYLPAYGDRLAVRSYAAKTQEQNLASKRTALIDDLSKVIEGSKPKQFTRKSTYGTGNQNATKLTRKIEIGWKHMSSSILGYQQVRKRFGGGTRELSISKTAVKQDILKRAKELFFPDGVSPKGPISDFNFDIKDFKDGEFPDDVTVADLFDKTKLRGLRFYLYTTPTEDDQIPSMTPKRLRSRQNKIPPQNQTCTSSNELLEPLRPNKSSNVSLVDTTSSCYKVPHNSHLDSSGEVTFGPFDADHHDNSLDDTLPMGLPLGKIIDKCIEDMLVNDASLRNPLATDISAEHIVPTARTVAMEPMMSGNQHDYEGMPPSSPRNVPNMQSDSQTDCNISTAYTTQETASTSTAYATQGTASTSTEYATQGTASTSTAFATQGTASTSTSYATQGTASTSTVGNECTFLREMPSLTQIEGSSDSYECRLNRCKTQDELLHVFKTPGIETLKLSFNFKKEKGKDADGVSRDVYAEFWQSFLERSAEGEDERIPVLSTAKCDEEWKALGRILLKGYQDHRYFPLNLSRTFIIALMHGPDNVSSEILYDGFLKYISVPEKEMLISALDGTLDADDEDDYIDFLSRMGHNSIPKAEDLKPVILQVAHKKLIQESKFALDMMASTAADGLRQFFPNVQNIIELYQEKKPTTKKVLKLLSANVQDDAQNKALNFLKQFIRSLDLVTLGKFLRFVTGSDIICVPSIEIAFTRPQSTGTRHPVAHTCGPLLEIPVTYPNYPEFRADFQHLLESNFLEMQIL